MLTVRRVVAAALAAVTSLAFYSSPAAAAPPGLTFANSATQGLIGSAYTKAMANLLTTNTVSYDPAVYNSSGLMTSPPGTFVRAGGGYAQPWTRDASVNSWNAASLLEPAAAANTLWSVVTRQSNGQLEIVQDNQWWDQVIWLSAAWNHYLVTGDRTFLTNAYQAGANTLAVRRGADYNATYGLFQGPSFFNDGISGYPAPPADATESQGSFVGSYPGSNTIMALSTNALYYQAYRSAALMAGALGRPASEAAGYNASADNLRTAINQRLWDSARGTYGYFLRSDGTLDPHEEGTGLSFAVLFGIAGTSQARSLFTHTDVQPYGIVDTYPAYPRYSATQPGRHNVSVWPVVQGFWGDAAASTGDAARFTSEFAGLARLAGTSGQFAEIYNAQTGAVDGGWQTGGHWGAAPDQTWSASAYLRMVYDDLFGLHFTTGGITFAPTLPWGWGDATLTGIVYRAATLTVRLHGAGSTVSAFTLDGTTSATPSIPVTLSGTHTVDITLTGGKPGEIRAIGNTCLDVSNAATANSTPIQIWGCDDTNAQTFTVAGNTLRVLGKCADVTGGGTAAGTKVSLYDCNGTGAQTWLPQPNGALLNPQSGRCLDDPGGSAAWGTQAQLWDCNGTAAQRWYLPA